MEDAVDLMGIVCVFRKSTSTAQEMGGAAPDIDFGRIPPTTSIGGKAFPTVVTEKVNPLS